MNSKNDRTNEFIKSHTNGISVSVSVKPGSKKNSIEADQNGIKIKISAPPVDGKANTALVKYLSELLDLPKSAITIERGLSSKNKVLKICGISSDEFRKKIFM